MGLQVLEREKSVFNEAPTAQPELEDHAYILERQLKPEARTDIVRELSDLGVKPTSMIDISDGLASECMHLMAASSVGVRVYEEKLPIDQKLTTQPEHLTWTLLYVCLAGERTTNFYLPFYPDDYEKLRNHPKLSFIGHMVENPSERIMVTKSGSDVELKAQGWDGINKNNG